MRASRTDALRFALPKSRATQLLAQHHDQAKRKADRRPEDVRSSATVRRDALST